MCLCLDVVRVLPGAPGRVLVRVCGPVRAHGNGRSGATVSGGYSNMADGE